MPSQLTYSIRALNAEHTKFIYEFMAIEHIRTHSQAKQSIHAINVKVNIELEETVFRSTEFREILLIEWIARTYTILSCQTVATGCRRRRQQRRRRAL